MATLEQLNAALVKADAAGNTTDAKAFADEIRKMRGVGEAPVALAGATPTTVPATAAPRVELTGMAQPDKPQSAWERASGADIVAGLPLTRAVMGVGAPVIGLAQLGVNIAEKFGLDPKFGQAIAEHVSTLQGMKVRGMAALGEPSSNDLIGGAASMALPGVGLSGKMAPATSYLGRVAQGAGVGGAAGLTTPSATSGLEAQLEQGVSGAVLGGGIPAVAPAVAAVARGGYRSMVEPWLNPGAIRGRAYLEAAGEKAPQIYNALIKNEQLVPGSMPTAGQAAVGANRPEWSAFQKSAAEGVLPENYLARTDAQKAAQIAQVQTVGQTPAALKSAEASRAADALINYARAETEGFDDVMAKAMKPQIRQLMSNPSIKEAKVVAADLARRNGMKFDGGGSIEGLDWLKKGLDENIGIASKSTSAVGDAKLRALMQAKEDLLATIKELSPAYDEARSAFAKASVPINQMEVGQYLEKKLVPALGEGTGALKARGFATAVQDAPGTIKRALGGGPRYQELKDVLTPQQLSAVRSVEDDLARQARDELLAEAGSATAPNALDIATGSMRAATGGKGIPNPLSRVVTVANALIGRLEGKIDRKLAIEIATEMLDPKATAAVLKEAMQREARRKGTKALIGMGRIPATFVGTQNMLAPESQNAMVP